jgi:RNA polymerase sigma-70 factor (ECF subfamily)
MADSTSQVTRLLEAWRNGDSNAAAKLMPLVYDELKQIAQRYMSRERTGHTLQATALVNEAYLRVMKQVEGGWKDRLHFLAVASQMMRRLLVDHARLRAKVKRGAGWDRISLAAVDAAAPAQAVDVLELHSALDRLAALDPRKAQVVELRYFGGLNVEEIAEALEIAPITVKREWAKAKAWLYNELNPGETS